MIEDFESPFDPAFTSEMGFRGESFLVSFDKSEAGKVRVEGGAVCFQEKELDLGGISGEFPVEYSVASSKALRRFNASGKLVAYARVLCSQEKPVRWAVLDTDVRIESGMLQISDPSYHAEMERVMSENDIHDYEELRDFLKESRKQDISFEVLQETAHSVHTRINGKDAIDIDSGFGDGVYVVYAGYGESGSVCRVVCDFDVVSPTNWEKYL